ncbi:MAG: endonuclease domain-containing protein [Rhizobiales bacterium]|nr:endonuclease domain-containing protein [Hyphomicrobiales bacterium]
MTRTPPHPEPLRGSALSHEGRGEEKSFSKAHKGRGEESAFVPLHEGRGERKLVSKRQLELLTRVRKKKASQSPSPLVGEGGGAQSAAPGEGALPPVLFARKLRETMTDAERRLWHALKDRRFAHLKFRRQVPMGVYVADFLSHEARLVVEVDGGQHVESKHDAIRDAWFVEEGYEVLRFWNHDVMQDLNSVLDTVAAKAGQTP